MSYTKTRKTKFPMDTEKGYRPAREYLLNQGFSNSWFKAKSAALVIETANQLIDENQDKSKQRATEKVIKKKKRQSHGPKPENDRPWTEPVSMKEVTPENRSALQKEED